MANPEAADSDSQSSTEAQLAQLRDAESLSWDPSGIYLEAVRDPEVKNKLREVREEMNAESERSSLLRRSVTTARNLGKVAFHGDFGEMFATALRRVF